MSQDSKINLQSILGNNKLTGTNFFDWQRKLRIVLKQERKLYVIDEDPVLQPVDDATEEEFEEFERYTKDAEDVCCIMLASMSANLQKQCEKMEAHEMMMFLQNLFQEEARRERYETSKKLLGTKMAEGAPVSEHVLKLLGYHDHLTKLGFTIQDELMTDIILQSLPPSYSQFVMNHNMNNILVSLSELHGMLKTAEPIIKGKTQDVLMVQPKWMKRKGQPKKPEAKKAGPSLPKAPVKQKVPKEGKCFHCGEPGHWKRNCKKYLAELKKQKAGETKQTSGTKE